MARIKKSQRHLKQEAERLTWTRFHLPGALTWPKWSQDYSNPHIGPLTNVAGCEKVLLGRQVEDSEQACLIILWSSIEVLEAFESSPACAQLLRDLRGEKMSPTSLFALQFDLGFETNDSLHGRVTLTILHLRNADDDSPLRAACKGLAGFLPAGCEDLRGPPMSYQRQSWGRPARKERPQESNIPRETLCYIFYRWNGTRSTPEREDASAHDAEAQQSWADAVAEGTPPIVAWEQQRWQIKAAPGYAESIQEEEWEDSSP